MRKENRIRITSVLRKIYVMLLALCLSSLLLSVTVKAAEKRIVRVAFFPMDGFHMVMEDGSFGGMDVEYLKSVCEYANWEIEYVPCDSWEDALQLLKEKKVDLVGSAQYSEERAQLYQYADLASGYTFGAIVTNGDSTLAYEDFTAMKGITFGMVENYVRKEEFLQYLKDNGISSPKIKEYTSTAILQEALDQGEVDAFVHTFTEVREGQRLVGRFAPKPFYYITYQGNEDVMRELNQAIADLKMNVPELETELMNEYYHSRLNKEALLSTEEKEFILHKQTVAIGYVDGYYPFSYEENGEFKGLTRNLLDSWASNVGLTADYCKMSSMQEAKEALLAGKIDMISYCADIEMVKNENSSVKTIEYAEIPLVLVTKKDASLEKIRNMATISYLSGKAGNTVDITSAVIHETQQECLMAVKNGEADAAICDGYLTEHLFRTEMQYSDLQITSVLSGDYAIAMVIGGEENEELAGIMAKTFAVIDSKMINTYMLKESSYPLLSIKEFVAENSMVIICILIAVIIIIMLVASHIISDGKKIQKLMYKDTQIDIWNLNYLIFFGNQMLVPDRKEQYATVYVNLAQFRRYNIIYGWHAGEKVLQTVAGMLSNSVEEKGEICARNQGDRFVLLLKYESEDAFRQRLEEIKNRVENRIFRDTENHMVVQMGIYYIPQDQTDINVAIGYANQVLELAGTGKADAIKIYDDVHETMMKERHEREKLLEAVTLEEDFTVYYQSKVDIGSERIIGAEALVRFLDPTANGTVRSPAFFISYYEQTGKITEVDFFVLESVCKMLRRRMDEGKTVVCVSCNFSRMHFIKEGFIERFEEILQKYRIPKELIEVEVTETLLVEEMQHQIVKQTFEKLRQKGVRLSIDDFGSGYSSLGTLEQIPASVIKLDRSFLLNKEDRERQVKIMRGIVQISEDLKIQIVCEGVETDEDVKLMKEIGASVAQGYYYFKPVSEPEFEKQLDKLS